MAYGDRKKREKPDAVLANALGGAPRGRMAGEPPPRGGMMDDEMEMEAPEEELSPAFEDHALTAFPELEGQPDRLVALKKAIHECLKAGY